MGIFDPGWAKSGHMSGFAVVPGRYHAPPEEMFAVGDPDEPDETIVVHPGPDPTEAHCVALQGQMYQMGLQLNTMVGEYNACVAFAHQYGLPARWCARLRARVDLMNFVYNSTVDTYNRRCALYFFSP